MFINIIDDPNTIINIHQIVTVSRYEEDTKGIITHVIEFTLTGGGPIKYFHRDKTKIDTEYDRIRKLLCDLT